MELNKVVFTKKEHAVVLLNTLYDFLPIKKIVVPTSIFIFLLYTSNTWVHDAPHMPAPFVIRLLITTMITAMATLIIFVFVPIIYEELWKDIIVKNFNRELDWHRRVMQDKILKQTDEIILQQKRK